MLTTLALIIGVLATAIVLVSAYFFQRARRREEAAPDSSDAIVEMRALGQRIETLVGQQQLQGETARQQLAQKMDSVGQTVDQQRHHLAGLQNELRHEVRRRDAEMEDFRTQLASIQQTTRLEAPPALALPEPPAAAPLAETPPAETPAPPVAEPPTLDTPTVEAPAFETPIFETSAFETPAFETPAFETPAFETPAFETPAFETPAFPAFQTGDGVAFTDDGWDTGEAPAALPVFSDPFVEATPPADAPPALPVFQTVNPFSEPDPFAGPEAAPESDFEPFDFVPPADPVAPHRAFDAPSDVTFENLTPTAAPSPAAPPPAAPPSQTAWVARADRADAAPEVLAFQAPVFEAVAAESATFTSPAFETPTFETPTFETPTFEEPTFEEPTFEEPAAAAPPAGADRLTAIPSIDEAMQTALYAAGVTTLDEIARWSRTDARRISAEVAVSEDTIMNLWIFEAQAALFQSFAAAQKGR